MGGFNLVFQIRDVRIFVATLIDATHLWVPLLGPKDVVMFYDPWTIRPHIPQAVHAAAPHPENIYFLCSDWQTYYLRKRCVRNTLLVSHNCFIDETVYTIKEGVEKEYDAVYNGRRSRTKRHYLAKEVGENLKLSLIYPHHDLQLYDVPEKELPRHVYHNKINLGPDQVCHVLNQSRVGLILSDVEGACFSSSEYLLCGLPVVSTPSQGGRSLWYNDENSLIVDPDPRAVLEGVQRVLAAGRDPRRIRDAHLEEMRAQRQTLIDRVLAPVAERFGLGDWDYVAAFNRCNLADEFAFKKPNCWFDLEGVRRQLRG
ncbi:glycosyltransferase [Methylocella silvestris]|uniref:Glycosyl transferase family 1 domain-containing protein n=1 Tax=Methylocella silvestris TaxID=199596 RepID=A0A2J7TEI8_METSI|nr:glycosyltransferase [Methylocella silvestris]PNG25187.1 hypothetical protein CR492_14500 [Methylocella silvestris]